MCLLAFAILSKLLRDCNLEIEQLTFQNTYFVSKMLLNLEGAAREDEESFADACRGGIYGFRSAYQQHN